MFEEFVQVPVINFNGELTGPGRILLGLEKDLSINVKTLK